VYPIGSIIQRPLKEMGVLSIFYKHVGIYIGVHLNDNKEEHQVIHFSPKKPSEPKSKAKIIKTSFDKFANGDVTNRAEPKRDKEVEVTIRAKPKNADHGRAICNEAEKIYCNPNEYNNEYNLFFKNCEDFAKYCYEYEVEYQNGHTETHTYPKKSQLRKTVEIAGGLAVAGVGILGLLKGGDDKENKQA